MRGIVWFRRDLRLTDQPALTAACEECDEVIPLFVFDEPLLQSHVFGSACVNFMLGCLQDCAASLAGRGLALQWRRGEPEEEVVRAAREWKVDVVYWNRDYEPRAIERDRVIASNDWRRAGVLVRTFKDHVVFEAEEVRGCHRRADATIQRLSRTMVDEVAGDETAGSTGSQSVSDGDKAVPLAAPHSTPTAR